MSNDTGNTPDNQWPSARVEGLTPIKGYSTIVAALRSAAVLQTLGFSGEPFRFNEMTLSSILGDREVKAETVSSLRERLQLHTEGIKALLGVDYGGGLNFTPADVGAAVYQVSKENSFHPVRDWLESLPQWDGTCRLARVASEVLGNGNPVASIMVSRFFISMVARVMKPGCKVDSVLVLVGPQGLGKSTFFATVAGRPEWFADSPTQPDSKDAAMLLNRVFIWEWSELNAPKSSRSADAVKGFISSTHDTFRPPYGRTVEQYPRGSVIVGTTNDQQFLDDTTGNRRYLPVRVDTKANLERLKEWRVQLFAEGLERFRSGEQWHLTDDEEAMANEVRRTFEYEDPWTERVEKYVERQESITVDELLRTVSGDRPETWSTVTDRRVAGILRRLGFEKSGARKPTNGKRRHLWVRTKPLDGAGPTIARVTAANDDVSDEPVLAPVPTRP